MHAVGLLHRYFKKACVGIHSKRLSALFNVVEALTLGSKLSITGMGRSLKTSAKTKSNIKCVDRLVGNSKLQNERLQIYKAAIKWIIGTTKEPVIIIDWTGLPNHNFYALRAAVPTQGRTITIYEEAHHKSKQNNSAVHKSFLKNLSQVIPKSSKPITVTDAGFHSPFFKDVEKLGWNWVGRIRNLTKYSSKSGNEWIHCKKLYTKATSIPKFIDTVTLSKSTPIACSLFVYKGKKKGRIAKNKFGKRKKGKGSKVQAKTNKEPWILATSLKGKSKIAKKVTRLYKSRMQIEEAFRDIKNSRLGFSFHESQTYSAKRFEILLLIGMLAILCVTILGKAGENRSLQFSFQANTIRNRAVLSLFFLGCQIIKDERITFSNAELEEAVKALISTTNLWMDTSLC